MNRCNDCGWELPRFGCPYSGCNGVALHLNPRSVDEKTVAERKWQAGLKPSAPQHACDHGLFSDEALQLDLVEMFQTEEE